MTLRLIGSRMMTASSSILRALAASIQALVHPGDEVVVLEPAYDSYEPIAELCGATVRRVPLTRPDFGVDWQRLRDALSPRTRLVIVNTPHNPSGACLGPADLDGAYSTIEHFIDVEPDIQKVRVGMRVRAILRPREERTGDLNDILHFAPIGEA